jgi:hypothetical protein
MQDYHLLFPNIAFNLINLAQVTGRRGSTIQLSVVILKLIILNIID